MSTTEAESKAEAIAESRRAFLRRGGVVSLSAVALGLVACAPGWAAKATPEQSMSPDDDVKILNVALGLEYEAIAAYQVGAESGLLTKPVLNVAVKFQSQHRAHAGVLSSTISKLGGTAVEAKSADTYGFPTGSLHNQADVLRFAAGLEKGAASAYLGAVPQFHNRDLAKAAASILGDETMHWAILRNALGEDPVPNAFIA